MNNMSRSQNEKPSLDRLTEGLNLADHEARQASLRYVDKAWSRTGKHLRRALEEYGQEETRHEDSRSK